jgi:hypothetical protein
MFISKLTHIVEAYDPYGVHRLNGVKVVYILFILCLFNMLFHIPHVYFYYFYIPITAMSAEVMADSIKNKYRAFNYTMIGTCAMVFLFNILRPYPLIFLFSIFLSSIALYVFALNRSHIMIPLVPIILSLASYSLLYPDLNANFNMVLNNAITTMCSMMIILSSLILFPLSYYYRLWLRSFILLLQEILNNLLLIQDNKKTHPSLTQGHTKHLITFANMLPRKLPIYTILKINLLSNQLHMHSCVRSNQFTAMQPCELSSVIQVFQSFILSVKQEQPHPIPNFHNQMLTRLVQAWNYLCSKK